MQTNAENRDTEKAVLNKELGKVLEESLQQIPIAHRSVFLLREIEGFSVAETAELLGITPVNVKVRLNRAKAMLQKQLEKFYSAADLYEFHLAYCDKIVKNVFERIAASNRK
jgi:RNA polymerase sigma-70 factor (ECF subfamily)